jgi:trimeric autotransporter adhesin
LSAGTRRNGIHKTGPFARADYRLEGLDALAGETGPFGQHSPRYTAKHASARHATSRPKTARWAGKAAPAAAMAATLAAGAAIYGLAGGHSAAGQDAAISLPVRVGSVASANVGSAEAAAARMANRKTDRGAAPKASAKASASASPAKTATAQPAAAAQPVTAAQPAQSPAAAQSSSASTVSCSDDSSLLPLNVTAIVNFLLGNGYSQNAAAGIAGNIYQESGGNPESIGSGGGGLIGWTPLQAGFVTGNPEADLQTQLAAILTYNNGWSAYLPALNSAASPADAAYIYVTDFERAGIPAASTREAAADAVAAACGI